MPRRPPVDLTALAPPLLQPMVPGGADPILLGDLEGVHARVAVVKDADHQIHEV